RVLQRLGREDLVGRDIIMYRKPQLLQVIDALGPPRRLARRLDGGQEQRDQDRDNGDHHQQLDQREPTPPAHGTTHETSPFRCSTRVRKMKGAINPSSRIMAGSAGNNGERSSRSSLLLDLFMRSPRPWMLW